MASSSSLKHLSLLFLLLLSSFSLQIHARDSQFFSKVTPYSTTNREELKGSTDQKNNIVPQNEDVSSFRPDDQEQPNLNQPENQNGYGLYGHDQVGDQFSPATTTTSTSSSVHYSTSSNLPNARENDRFNNNNYYDNNGYNSKGNSFNEPRYQENFDSNNDQQYDSFNDNDVYKREQSRSINKNNRYPTERQGMSDTRFMENGRYFYDANSENSYPNEFQQNGRGRSREYGSSSNTGVEGRNQYYNNNNNNNNGGYSYGNNRNSNEFSRNSMGDQYQRYEENFGNQEEFDP